MQENDRYRGLIETLLRHPAFTPFINDISKDPAVLGMPQQQPQQQMQRTPSHQPPQPQPQQPQQQQQQQPDVKPDFMNFDASQLQVPSQQQQHDQQQVGLAMIPEEDFSKLNLNRLQQQTMNFNGYQSVNAYAVTDLPSRDPVELLIESPAGLPSYCSSGVATPSYAAFTADYAAPSDMSVLLAKLDGAARKLGPVY